MSKGRILFSKKSTPPGESAAGKRSAHKLVTSARRTTKGILIMQQAQHNGGRRKTNHRAGKRATRRSGRLFGCCRLDSRRVHLAANEHDEFPLERPLLRKHEQLSGRAAQELFKLLG